MCFFFLKEAKNQQEYMVHFFLTFLVFLKWLKMCTPDCYQTFRMVVMLDAHGAFFIFFIFFMYFKVSFRYYYTFTGAILTPEECCFY